MRRMAALWLRGVAAGSARAALGVASADFGSASRSLAPIMLTPYFQQTRAFGAGDLKIVAARMKSVKSIQKVWGLTPSRTSR